MSRNEYFAQIATVGADRPPPIDCNWYLRAHAALLAALLITLPASAQQAKIVGLGARGCAQFMLEITQNPALQRVARTRSFSGASGEARQLWGLLDNCGSRMSPAQKIITPA